jgi:hypothetical protein
VKVDGVLSNNQKSFVSLPQDAGVVNSIDTVSDADILAAKINSVKRKRGDEDSVEASIFPLAIPNINTGST